MAGELVSGNGTPVGEVRGLSQLERVVDTFVAPSKTFNDIFRSTAWWLPFVLLVITSFGFVTSIDKKVGFDRVVQNQIHDSPKTEDRFNSMEPATRAQAMRMQTTIVRYSSYGFWVFLAIWFAVYAVMLWAAFNFGLGAQTTYPQVLCVTWYAALPYLLQSIIAVLVLQFGNDPDAFNMQNPIGTNLGYYLGDGSPMLKAALGYIDVIKLWSVVLQVMGMAIIARKTIVQSAVVVGIFWAVGLLLVTAGAAFR